MFEYIYQILVGLSGFLLLYAGLFVYPDERQNLINRVEELWLKWSEISDTYEGKFLKYGKAVANKFTSLFDKYFGQDLISRRSVMTSVVLSAWLSPMLAIFVGSVIGLVVAMFSGELDLNYFILWVFVSCGLFSLFIRWIFGGIIRESFIDQYTSSTIGFIKHFLTFIVAGPASIIIFVVMVKSDAGLFSLLYAVAVVVILVVVVLASDIISIYFTRLILSKVRLASSTSYISGAYFADALVAFSCAAFPALFLLAEGNVDGNIEIYFLALGYSALLMNVTTLAPTFVYLGLSIVIGLNGIIWSTFLRPLYSMVDNRVFERKRSLATVGGLLLVDAVSPGTVSGLSKAIFSALPN